MRIKSQAEMAKLYIGMMKHEFALGNMYSWEKWGNYNSLRVARAHKYAEKVQKFFEYGQRFSNREAAAKYGKGSRVTYDVLWESREMREIEAEFVGWCNQHDEFRKHVPEEGLPF